MASNVGGPAEALEDEVGALLVPPEDVERLAEALTRILTEPELSHRLGTAARLQVERHYDLAHQTRRLETHYDEARFSPTRTKAAS